MRIYEYVRMPRIIKRSVGVSVLIAAFVLGFAVISQAQTQGLQQGIQQGLNQGLQQGLSQGVTQGLSQGLTQGITFPIAELGNCADKEACRDYCNEPQNMEACIAFAEKHGLMNRDESGLARKFAGRVRSGGPGGCRTPKECEAFCSKIENFETCVKFAEENGLATSNLREGRKIVEYLKSGGELPGGCNSRENCEVYCRDLSHAEECFAFAEKVGIGPAAPPGQFGRGEPGPRPEQIRKFVELAKKGETPGGCRTTEQCEAYCRVPENRETCLEFGVKAGFIEREHAEKIKQAGFRGPGGCDSPQSCSAYCNEPGHREECLRFAEAHGFISQEEAGRVREGFVRARAGFEQAPEEVRACLEATLGEDIIGGIQSGKIVPGPEIAERMRACFDKFGHSIGPRRVFADAPPEVAACLKEKLGEAFEKIRAGELQPTPEMADTFRVCFEKVRLFEGGAGVAPPPEKVRSFTESAPPAVAQCLKERLGNLYEDFVSGKIQPGPEIYERVRSCFEEFKPEVPSFAPPNPLSPGAQKGIFPPSTTTRPYPLPIAPIEAGSSVLDCVRLAGGEELTRRWQEGFRPEQSILEKIAACIAAKMNASQGGICIQVVTPAHDPATGACKEFPTPCDVPPGWLKGCPSTYPYPQPTEPYRAPYPNEPQPTPTGTPSSFVEPDTALGTLLLPVAPLLNFLFR